MNKNMALISSCLLLFSTQLLADRPAVSEQNTGPELQAPAEPNTEAPTQMTPAKTEPAQTTAPVEENNETPATKSTKHTGDVLELKAGETLPIHALDFPQRGTSMDNVQKELGEPLEILPAVGDPPITTWSYNDRTIYFEGSRVIHAVSNP